MTITSPDNDICCCARVCATENSCANNRRACSCGMRASTVPEKAGFFRHVPEYVRSPLRPFCRPTTSVVSTCVVSFVDILNLFISPGLIIRLLFFFYSQYVCASGTVSSWHNKSNSWVATAHCNPIWYHHVIAPQIVNTTVVHLYWVFIRHHCYLLDCAFDIFIIKSFDLYWFQYWEY